MKMKSIVLIIFIMVLLTSCAVNPNVQDTTALPERIYVSSEITYSEPMEQFAFRQNMDSVETESAKYFFEASIENQEREACVEATETVLANQILEGTIPEIYIFSQERYDYKYIHNHKLYSSIQDWRSVEYITDVLIAVYGETVHYGAAFGYANHLTESNEWSSYDSKFSIPSVRETFDLNYLCFDDDFTAPNDVAIAKGIACDFAGSYISQRGEQAFQQLLTSHINATDALTLFYKENGVSYSPSAVQYGYGGKTYDYIVYSDYGTFYITNNWVDANAQNNPLITDGFLHSNYADTKTFFETNLQQMKQYQDLFQLDGYHNDLDIVFSKQLSISQNSFYQSGIHRIYLYNVDSLMHEYIHALTMPAASMASWQVEGFARYFSYYFDHYGIALLNQDYNNTPDTPTTKFIHEYLATINRPIDMVKDYREIENAAVYYFSFTNPNANYAAGSSFVQYLVKQYGEEAVINSIYGNGNALPKSYAELLREWYEFIETNYSNYSKYK